MTTRCFHLTPTCSWASCPRTDPPHKVGKWDFCTEHLAEHRALFEPNRPGRPAKGDGPKCGTKEGYQKHLRAGTVTCQACRDANCLKVKTWKKRAA